MSYWKYRAFDSALKVHDGVIMSPLSSDQPPDILLLQLRNQGLQVIDIRLIDKIEYDHETYLQKLRDRTQSGPCQLKAPLKTQSGPLLTTKSGTSPTTKPPTTKDLLFQLWDSIFKRKND